MHSNGILIIISSFFIRSIRQHKAVLLNVCMELNNRAKKNCAGLTYIRYTDPTKHATAAKYIRSNCHTYLHIKIVFRRYYSRYFA